MKIVLTRKDGKFYASCLLSNPFRRVVGPGLTQDEAIGSMVLTVSQEKISAVSERIVIDDQTKDLADRITEKLHEQWGRLGKESVAPIIRKILESAHEMTLVKRSCKICLHHAKSFGESPCCDCRDMGTGKSFEVNHTQWEPKDTGSKTEAEPCKTCAHENVRLENWPCCACSGLYRVLRWKQK